MLTESETLTRAELEASAEYAIRLENASVCYHVPHERYASLKEHIIRLLQQRLEYNDFWALSDIRLDIRRGQVVGIIGRNGAGKSTLLKVIARVLRPTRGRVWVRGRVAPLLEFGAGFHPELTGRENVFLNGALLGFSRAEMQAKFARIVDFAELWDFIDAPLRTYSSGMVARLGFAVASDVDPDILIIDEVLSVGDAAFQRKSLERIQGFRAAGATILYVSHSLGSVQTMCDRVVWLDNGRIVADGSPEAVVSQYLERDRGVEAQRLADQKASPHRWGNCQVELTRVWMTDGGGEGRTIFQTGDPFVLHIHYRTHGPVPSPVFGMAIHRQDGIHITGPNTSFAGLTLATLAGEGEVIFSVPYMPLLEGLYHISVAVVNRDDTEIFDYHDRAYPFRVVNSNGQVREQHGLMTLRGEWKVQGCDR